MTCMLIKSGIKNNMTREELKHLWFNLPRVKPVKELKAIVITRHGDNHYSCERQTQTQEYWASSSSNFSTFEGRSFN